MKILKTIALALMLCATLAVSAQAPADTTLKPGVVNSINAQQFHQLITESTTEWAMKSSRPAVIDFNAYWCGPCRMLTPALDKLAKEYEGKVDFYSINVDFNKELSRQLGIRSIPYVMFCPVDGKPFTMVGIESNDPDKILKSVRNRVEKLLK